MGENSRLAWRCRRGMREMDILFEKFVQTYHEDLSEHQKNDFEAFVDETDADIYSWLTGSSQPENPGFQYIINIFRTIQGE